MLVTNLYRVPPYVVAPSSRSCFIVLLLVPNNWRLLLLDEWHSLMMCFIIIGVSSPQSSHVGGCSLGIKCPCVSLLWPILIHVRHLPLCRVSCTVLGNMYVFSVISDHVFGRVEFHFSFHFSWYVFLMYVLRSFLVC